MFKIKGNEFVTCDACGVLVLKRKAETRTERFDDFDGFRRVDAERTIYFCATHAPQWTIRDPRGVQPKYYKLVECYSDGSGPIVQGV